MRLSSWLKERYIKVNDSGETIGVAAQMPLDVGKGVVSLVAVSGLLELGGFHQAAEIVGVGALAGLGPLAVATAEAGMTIIKEGRSNEE